MKKRALLLCVFSLMLAMLVACGDNSDSADDETFKVKFDLDGGKKVSGSLSQQVKKGEAAEEPEAEREGYVFDGWDDEFDNITGDVTITAIWKELFVVTFDPNGGEIKGKKRQEVSSVAEIKVPKVEREGYEFEGWDKELPNKIREDITFTAQWKASELTAEEVYEKIEPSVVEIVAYDENQQAFSVGSGFFIDSNGTIATNEHVIDAAYYLQVSTYDGQKYIADKVVAYSKELDLAIIHIDAKKTAAVTISTREISTGEKVYTLGSSTGLTDTFSDGIISNTDRVVSGKNCIQITAPISHGNSGGPLIDSKGEVLGINSMVMTEGQNLNFSIKIAELEKLDKTAPLTVYDFGKFTSPDAEGGDEHGFTEEEKEYIAKWEHKESEPNDTYELANDILKNEATVATATAGDYDWYKFTLKEDTEITLNMLSYWSDDNAYLSCALGDADRKLIYTVDGDECISYDEEKKYVTGTYKLAAGDYYVLVVLDDEDYPFDSAAIYIIDIEY